MVEFDGLTPRSPPLQLNFNVTAFWIRMYNLPLACMGKEMRMRLGSPAGEVIEVDTDENGVGWGEFIRVRICVDVTKPLLQGRLLKL